MGRNTLVFYSVKILVCKLRCLFRFVSLPILQRVAAYRLGGRGEGGRRGGQSETENVENPGVVAAAYELFISTFGLNLQIFFVSRYSKSSCIASRSLSF